MPYDIELNEEDNAYLNPILADLTQRAHMDHPFTLDFVLNYWCNFIVDLEAKKYEGDMNEFINDVMLREVIEHDILEGASFSLRAKLDIAIDPWDERFKAATQELERPIRFLPEGFEAHWWWYRAPHGVVVHWSDEENGSAQPEAKPE